MFQAAKCCEKINPSFNFINHFTATFVFVCKSLLRRIYFFIPYMDGGVLKSERVHENLGEARFSAFKAGSIYLQETGSKKGRVGKGGGRRFRDLKNRLEESERDKWKISGLQVAGGVE
ncbi:hypothetical protein CDAR_459221 [Caerostris darwini]|uniref:Uncharacterized protein n=1 Tax=Caerostris darwini TaxID=1538125 RepID=A0AAV4PKM8_9ARAC|nr:hypothetical protein CDAR_459221 [Caerostris darwini]